MISEETNKLESGSESSSLSLNTNEERANSINLVNVPNVTTNGAKHSSVSQLSVSSVTSSPKNEPSQGILSYAYHISPSTIPGILHFNNYGAIDWSANGLLAYGCQNRIVIVNTNNAMTYSQTLHRHKHVVCMVRWSPASNNHCLASIDLSGAIIVWNVLESTPLTVILPSNETKLVNFFHWICMDCSNSSNSVINSSKSIEDNNHNRLVSAEATETFKTNQPKTSFLFVFYQQNNCIVLYDAELGEPVVKWQLEYQVSLVAFNPFFTFNRSCDTSVPNFLFNFKPVQANDDRLYLGLARVNYADFTSSDDTSKDPKKHKLDFDGFMLQRSTAESVTNKVTVRVSRYDLISRLEQDQIAHHLASASEVTHNHSQSVTSSAAVVGNNSSSSNENCIQIEFHKAMRNHIFVVFSRDIYLIDLSIETIINIIPIERNCSKIMKIFSCSHRNAFYALHESGNVSFRFYQKKVIFDRSNQEKNLSFGSLSGGPQVNNNNNSSGGNSSRFLNVGYINLCQSEPIRLTKQNKIFGYSLAPFDETRIAFLLSSGRIVVKSLICHKMIQSSSMPNETMDNGLGQIVNQHIAYSCLSDLIKPQKYQLGAFLLPDSCDQQRQFDSILYKIHVTHFISGLNSLPTVVRMCPPLTLQNIDHHRPLLAVGDSLGLIQIWLLQGHTSSLHREFSVHSYPVAGIEWTSLTSLVSFSYPTITSPSHHSNIAGHSPFSALSIVTSSSGSSSGRVTNELVSIDTHTGKVTPFRTNRIHDSSPIETIRVSHLKQYLIILFKHEDPFEIWDVKNLVLLRVMSKTMTNITAIEWSPLYNKKQVARNSEISDSDSSQPCSYVPIKENFIVTNRNLFHFSIEGNLVRELSCIPPDSDSGHVTVTSIAWKSDQVLLGDASGTLNLWHLKQKVSRTESTFRGYIRKIRFGPGRGNMKCLILYADCGVDIWDINEFRVCAQLKYPRDMNFKIIDVDWASCDLPILCTSEGFIFVTDTKLKTFSSSIELQQLDQSQLAKVAQKKMLQVDSMFNTVIDLDVNFISLHSKRRLVRQLIFTLPFTTSNETHSNGSYQVDIKEYIEKQILLAKLFANRCDFDFWCILTAILYGEELDSRLDLFLDARPFRHLQQEKLLLLESNRNTYSHARYAYQLNLQLKNFQRAVQILLETESFCSSEKWKEANSENIFYVDALKACLIASLQLDMTAKNISASGLTCSTSQYGCDFDGLSDDNETSLSHCEDQEDSADLNQSKKAKDVVAPVVKLVATSLIANGQILQGVELLNFISKTSDSCQYLQSADKWLDSIWLAKSSLDTKECTDVIRRWCELLISSNHHSDKETAIKMYLSRRQFSRVLRNLNRLSELKAFPFAVVCVAAQLIDIESTRDILEEIFNYFVTNLFDYTEQHLTMLKTSTEFNGSLVNDSTLFGEHDAETYNVLRQCWILFSEPYSK